MRPSLFLVGVVGVFLFVPSLLSSQGMPMGPEFRVNTYTYTGQGEVAVATDSAGDFVVVWQSYSQDPMTGVFGQRFSSSGAPLGLEFRVNTYMKSFQGEPAVASDSAGNF